MSPETVELLRQLRELGGPQLVVLVLGVLLWLELRLLPRLGAPIRLLRLVARKAGASELEISQAEAGKGAGAIP